MKKKFLAFALALVIAFALVPTVATYAATEIPPSATLPADAPTPPFEVAYVVEQHIFPMWEDWENDIWMIDENAPHYTYILFSSEPIHVEIEHLDDEIGVIAFLTYTFPLDTQIIVLSKMDYSQFEPLEEWVFSEIFLSPRLDGQSIRSSFAASMLSLDLMDYMWEPYDSRNLSEFVFNARTTWGVASDFTNLTRVSLNIETGATQAQQPTPPQQHATTTTAPNLTTASNWAHEGINNAFSHGLIPQNLQGAYTQATTRAEFAAFAVALYETVTGRTITERETFNDTTDINVQKMGGLGVVTGVGGGNFAPNNTLTREQAAVMLARLAYAIGQPLPQSAPTFADNASMSSWSVDSVGQIQAAGIMGGTGNNNFFPSGEYTREQSIITMLRLFEILN